MSRKRPMSGPRGRQSGRSATSSTFAASSATTTAALEDEDTLARRKFQEVDERRMKEWHDFQKRERSAEVGNTRIFADFVLGDVPQGRMVFELFDDVVPRVAENFRQLFQGTKGFDATHPHVKLDFIDNSCYRVVKNMGMLFGRLGGLSLPASGEFVKDENFAKRHSERGLLSTVSSNGPDSIGSTFCITLDRVAALDYQQVVFGKVVEGLSVLDKLEQVKCNKFGEPTVPVTISFCGALNGKRPPETTYPNLAASSLTSPTTRPSAATAVTTTSTSEGGTPGSTAAPTASDSKVEEEQSTTDSPTASITFPRSEAGDDGATNTATTTAEGEDSPPPPPVAVAE